jgi:hypothetical protein
MEFIDNKKRCSVCKESKLLSEYQFADKKRGYLQSRCKTCDKIANKTSYKNNLEKNRKKRNDWQEKNRARHNFHVRMYGARKREGKTWGLL